MKQILKGCFLFLLLYFCSIQAAAAASVSVTLNGTPLSFDPAPYIENGRVLVPMRGVLESLGYSVHWIEHTQTVLAMKGEERLAHNTESREEYIVSFHLENDGSDYAKEAAAPDFTDALLDKMEAEIQSEQLRNALSKLTHKQYIVVMMYFFENMTQEEIAIRLGITRSSVNSRLQGALKN